MSNLPGPVESVPFTAASQDVALRGAGRSYAVPLVVAVTGSATHDETISAGLPSDGVPADPDDAPNDAEMARSASIRFATLAAARVRSAAR